MSDNLADGSFQRVWRVDSAVRYRRLFDEGVLIHQEKGEALVLNDTALRFLELCDGRRALRDIIETMVEEFDVSAEQLALDLRPFIDQLTARDVIDDVTAVSDGAD